MGSNIPTCVGKWEPGVISERVFEVHPHVRGEMEWHNRQYRRESGSSPRAWGNGDIEIPE